MAASDSRDSCGCELAPLACGRWSKMRCASARIVAGSTPTASKSGAAMPSFCVSSANSRCAGLISGLPAAEAACRADVRAACVLVVGLKESTTPPFGYVVKMLVGMFNAVKVESIPLKFEFLRQPCPVTNHQDIVPRPQYDLDPSILSDHAAMPGRVTTSQ